MSAQNISFVEKYPYHIVEFIQRGRQATERKVDIVCTIWMRFDNQKRKVFVKYPPPPYTKDGATLYEQALENMFDPMSDWKDYHVKIKGKASDYETAAEKCESLKTSITALTMESDASVETMEKKAAENIKQMQLSKKAALVKGFFNQKSSLQSVSSNGSNSMTAKPLEPSEENGDGQTSFNQLKKGFSISKLPGSYEVAGMSSYDTATGSKEMQSLTINLLESSQKNDNRKTSSQAVNKHFSISKSPGSQDFIGTSTFSSASPRSNSGYKTAANINGLLHSILEFQQNIFVEIKIIKKSISNMQENIDGLRMNSGPAQNPKILGSASQLAEKYHYVIPFPSKDELKRFEGDLKINQELRRDFQDILSNAVDSTGVVSRSIVNMLKMFLSKNVAVQFTAIKSTQKKEAIIKTEFFKHIEIVIKDRRSHANMITTDKDMHGALTSVMSNTGAWDSGAKNKNMNMNSPGDDDGTKSQHEKVKTVINSKEDEEKSDHDSLLSFSGLPSAEDLLNSNPVLDASNESSDDDDLNQEFASEFYVKVS